MRTLSDVWHALPREAIVKAFAKLGFDPNYDVTSEEKETSRARSLGEDIDPQKDAWAKGLRFTQEGKLTKDAGNAALVLANLDEWRGALEYDSFADRILWVRPVPELPGLTPPKPGEDLADHHVTYVHHWFAKLRAVSFPKQAIQDALESAAKANARHPVREYLLALTWDR
jgi:hypothetical protein